MVAALLEKNERPMQIVIEGMRRSQFYSPEVAEDGDSLVNMDLLLGTSESRELVRQLAARAMLRLGSGDIAGAWRDILAGQRFVRLSSRRPLLLDRLIAQASANVIYVPTVTLAQQPALTSAQAREFQSQLRDLPARCSMKEAMKDGERAFALDGLLDLAVNRDRAFYLRFAKELESFADDAQKENRTALKVLVSEGDLDWDEALRLENASFDRLIEIGSEGTAAERFQRLKELGEAEAKPAREAAKAVLSRDSSSAQGTSPRAKAQQLVALLHGPVPLGGIWQVVLVADDRFEIRKELGLLAFALAAFRCDHGGYPKTLGELCPTYTAEIPKDPFSDADLIYKPTADGYLVYSVGQNGKDDGGRNYMDDTESWWNDESATEEEKSWDDIAIRMPPKKAEK